MFFLTDLTKYQKQRYNSVFLLWSAYRPQNLNKNPLKWGEMIRFCVILKKSL
jgi:hypothetical protein